MLLSDSLLQQTRVRFPTLDRGNVRITPMEKGGSGRKFYRIQFSPEQSIVLVKYSSGLAENRRYVEVARFLEAHAIHAPKIYFHESVEGLIWLEDLGERDLWSYRAESWPVRQDFYEAALSEIARLHQLSETAANAIAQDQPPEFDRTLYHWEQQYFFSNCLGRYFGLPEKELDSLGNLPALQEMAERLATFPRVLVHRDFQSQNVIIREGAAYLIDFQGMRPGLGEYDLASLVYDPYVSLTNKERAKLIEFYRKQKETNDSDFAEKFRLCAAQRLMQALGAYAYLGLVRGNRAFLEHIPAALYSLGEVIGEIAGLESLRERVNHLARESKGPFA